MKKLFFALCMLLTMTAWAAPVGKEKAMEEAAAFLAKKNPGNAGKQMRMAAKRDRLITANDEAYYYVFNVGENNGFVIVSGDDRTTPILGYADEGSFDIQKMPANMKAWLDGYAEQLKVLAEMSDETATKAMSAPRKARVNTRNSIAPLITAKWDQATPYWNKCPQFMNSEDEADGYELAYTGCVATAMSQIMYFHKKPAQTLAEIPSYTFTVAGENYTYSTVTMEAQPVTTFDWDHMRETYTGAEDEVYTDAVATLMFYAGCAVKMQYGHNSSGAYTDDIPKGFKYFGYGSKLAYRTNYTQDAWDDLVYSELAAGRPMIYNGTAGSGGGHSAICDGFEYGDYFHINWGWGGMGNGFFQLSILNPSASGIGGSSSSEGYNMKQNIVYNLIPGTATPDDEDTDVANELTATGISVVGTTPEYPNFERDSKSVGFSIYKRKTFTLNCADHSGSGKKYDIGLALYDGESYNVFINRGTFSTALTSAAGGSWTFENATESKYSKKILSNITGTYKIVPMYLLEGTTEWKPMKECDRFYLETTITNTQMSFTKHPIINLQATNFEFTGGEKVGSKEQINVTIQNNSEDRFYGDIFLDFGGQQLDENSQYTTVVTAEVPAGQSSVVTFNVTPENAGTQTVKAMLQGSSSYEYNSIGSGSVTIAEAGEQVETSNLSVEIVALASDAVKEHTHGTIYDSSVRFQATIKNDNEAEYNKYILAPLFICTWDAEKGKFAGSMVTYKQVTISVPAHESRDYYFDFDNLAYGNVYSMNIYARNNVPMDEDASHVDNIVTPGESKYYAIEPGIITWKGDGTRQGSKPVEGFAIPEDVAAVSLEGLNLASISASANPNTLYFLGEGETAPAGLEDKNVVTGAQAAKVVLKDGYDFYTPQTFTAAEISYERTFTQGHNNSVKTGWSTIVLPFAPTKVMNQTDNKEIDWFRSSSDSGKQFWTCDFAEEDGTTVYFRNAPEMLANTPYLVAVPDNKWGAKWDLRGKAIVWSAENATVKPDAIAYTSGQNMAFGGTEVKADFKNVLVLSEDGSQFVANNTANVDAFHGFFKNISEGSGTQQSAKAFNIMIINDNATGISETVIDSRSNNDDAAVYNLKGQRVGTKSQFQQLPRGIYVIGGQKVTK